MEDEKKIEKLSDGNLSEVNGGAAEETIVSGRYYRYIGSDEGADLDRKYVCPKCGRRVHRGTAWRYYCDDCNESWFFEGLLKPNLNSGVWQEIDGQEYYDGYWG